MDLVAAWLNCGGFTAYLGRAIVNVVYTGIISSLNPILLGNLKHPKIRMASKIGILWHLCSQWSRLM